MEKSPLLIREQLEKLEHQVLSPLAAKSDESKGRERPERPCNIRPAFQRDRDRIVHCKPFRRLKHKTQVFLAPTGDHYRTRLTHTIEVSQIARTAAKALFLNEDLTEAVALGHDLGHTPFGHAGEQALNQIHKGFHHAEHSLRVVEILANDGKGLNLTWEVRDGIREHTKGKEMPILSDARNGAATLEGKLVRAADVIAYTNHDLEDALQAKLIKRQDIPAGCLKILGATHRIRINTMLTDLILETGRVNQNRVVMSPRVLHATEKLREFLFEQVYEHPAIAGEVEKAKKVIQDLYRYFLEHPEKLLEVSGKKEFRFELKQEVCDFIAGMTDRYALDLYHALFVPRPWT
ncbi:MAG: deoxyguanosinetriphosphate triphosphohydrolase [Deltaproteobacteria bacterium RBG_13_61_14]|nr:MAG: deoxyguanosinetriphosphate triphosphohydrolase [Deltaproteobacteria bacterium RBG_13_61_14]